MPRHVVSRNEDSVGTLMQHSMVLEEPYHSELRNWSIGPSTNKNCKRIAKSHPTSKIRSFVTYTSRTIRDHGIQFELSE